MYDRGIHIYVYIYTSKYTYIYSYIYVYNYFLFTRFSAYITGVYGMNLDQTTTIQNVYGIFEAVFTTTFALIFIITGTCISIDVLFHMVYM
jgi:hypothetical protein